jgi:hypothetical protein
MNLIAVSFDEALSSIKYLISSPLILYSFSNLRTTDLRFSPVCSLYTRRIPKTVVRRLPVVSIYMAMTPRIA